MKAEYLEHAKAELAKFNQPQLDSYENSLKTYRDLKGVIDTAFDEGKIEGKIEVAKSVKQMGFSTEEIIKLTGLSAGEIDRL
jgi:hypothetical protein